MHFDHHGQGFISFFELGEGERREGEGEGKGEGEGEGVRKGRERGGRKGKKGNEIEKKPPFPSSQNPISPF